MGMVKSKLSVLAVALLALTVLMPQGASAVETPDEEDVLDLVDSLLLNPDLLPQPVDVGLVHESIENILPDLIDVWPDLQIGGCGLGTGGPSISGSGLRVTASAAYGCSSTKASIGVALCLQIRQGDQWVTMEGSCRGKRGAQQSSVSKRTSAYCRPGTWHYRVIAAGDAAGANGSADAASRVSGGSRLHCRTFGL